MMKLKNNLQKSMRAQIWVETVLYTVIGLAIIGIILAVATPVINEYKDEVVIKQTIDALNKVNQLILDVEDAPSGEKRSIELAIKRGSLTINSSGDNIIYVLEETELQYSEPGEEVKEGDIKVRTEEKGKKYNIFLALSYDNINITYNGNEEIQKFSHSATPYTLFVENNGVINDKVSIDIRES